MRNDISVDIIRRQNFKTRQDEFIGPVVNHAMNGLALLALVLSATFGAAPSIAQTLEAEDLTVEILPNDVSRDHWIWLTDYVLGLYGKAVLIDADSGDVKGSVDTGWEPMKIEQSRRRSEIYAIRVFLERGFRGKRTDVFTVFDTSTLDPIADIEIPPKRLSGFGTLAHSGLTSDERFLLSYNFTPASSVAIIDLESRAYVGEIELAGCALIYPTGDRQFFSLCGDGSALVVNLDNEGGEESRVEAPDIFDPDIDPIFEKAVSGNGLWYFPSFGGDLYVVEQNGDTVALKETWSLLDEAAKNDNWKPGGFQPFAFHEGRGLLYVLMHQGGDDTHKELGQEVWVFDVKKKRRMNIIGLTVLTGSIEVSQDEAPLLYTAAIFDTNLQIYDALSGDHRRTMAEAAFNPTVIQPVRPLQ
jgi:methylamine dehydrogenase heavy chain